MITKLRIDPDKVDRENAFRVNGWKVALVVSDQLRRELLANETTGILFEEVG
jgi:pyruvate dehydrogenase complex dehydrogenase (E1) component